MSWSITLKAGHRLAVRFGVLKAARGSLAVSRDEYLAGYAELRFPLPHYFPKERRGDHSAQPLRGASAEVEELPIGAV